MPVYKMPVLTLRRTGVLLSRNLKDSVQDVQSLFLFETANAMSHWGIFNEHCQLTSESEVRGKVRIISCVLVIPKRSAGRT